MRIEISGGGAQIFEQGEPLFACDTFGGVSMSIAQAPASGTDIGRRGKAVRRRPVTCHTVGGRRDLRLFVLILVTVGADLSKEKTS